MPLVSGDNPSAISKNIATERAAGKPEAQAVAIAEHKAKDSPAADCTEVMSLPELIKANEKHWKGQSQGDL